MRVLIKIMQTLNNNQTKANKNNRKILKENSWKWMIQRLRQRKEGNQKEMLNQFLEEKLHLLYWQ